MAAASDLIKSLECFLGFKTPFSVHQLSEDNKQQIGRLIVKHIKGSELEFWIGKTLEKIQKYIDSNGLAPLYFAKYDGIPFIFCIDKSKGILTLKGKVFPIYGLDSLAFPIVKATMEWIIQEFLPQISSNEKFPPLLFLQDSLHPYFFSYLIDREIPYNFRGEGIQVRMRDMKEPKRGCLEIPDEDENEELKKSKICLT